MLPAVVANSTANVIGTSAKFSQGASTLEGLQHNKSYNVSLDVRSGQAKLGYYFAKIRSPPSGDQSFGQCTICHNGIGKSSRKKRTVLLIGRKN